MSNEENACGSVRATSGKQGAVRAQRHGEHWPVMKMSRSRCEGAGVYHLDDRVIPRRHEPPTVGTEQHRPHRAVVPESRAHGTVIDGESCVLPSAPPLAASAPSG